MPWLKSAFAGICSAAAITVIFELLILSGIFPVTTMPMEQLLVVIGLEISFVPYILNLIFGIFWSLFLTYIFKNNTNLSRGLLLGFIIWLGFIFVFSPLVGWGLLTRARGETGWSAAVFSLLMLALYLFYGGLLGYLNNRWVYFKTGVGEEISSYRE
ncbi:MAG: DUF6789 family protein [bacterium]